METKKIRTILLHTIIWIAYIALPLFILPRPSEFLGSSQAIIMVYFVLSGFTILFFYFSYHLALPELYFKQRYLLFCISILGFLILTLIITRTLTILFFPLFEEFDPGKMRFQGSALSRFLLIFIVSFGLRYRDRVKELESERVKAELSALKSQVNPHFLFNTLNGIYGQALAGSEQTADSISRLSSMMRYVLTEANTETVSLESEILYIRSYIHLQKMRLTENTRVTFEVQGEIEQVSIPPLLFISFIENAFKYGVSNETESEIIISFSVEKPGLSLRISNQKVNQVNMDSHSSNTGMKNARRRLDLLYKEKYSLTIKEDKHDFLVNLKIVEI